MLLLSMMMEPNPFSMMATGLAMVFLAFFAVFLVTLIVSIIITWKLFNRAGVEGWKSLIPFYNTYLMIKIGLGESMTWLLLILLGGGVFAPLLSNILGYWVVNIIQLAIIIISSYISYSFYKRFSSQGMSIGATFIPIIFGSIIAFGDYPYTPIGENHEVNDYGY